MTVVDWIDVFTRANHKDVVIESLKYCIENKGLNLYSYCLMTNHLHLIVDSQESYELKDTIRDLKKYISKKVIKQIQEEPESRREGMLTAFENNGGTSKKHKTYKFWQTGNHAIEIFSSKFLWEKVMYIHINPVKDKYVNLPEDWRCSSASNYVNKPSLIDKVICVIQPLRVVT